jgi:DNA-binding XRE family transcriptional regulator
MSAKRHVKYDWDAESIRALRRYMGLSQQQMSEELGVRQQTVSEWETGMYQPRGGMRTLLTLVAERVGFAGPATSETPSSSYEWHDIPIARLDLKPRAINALHDAGHYHIGQVLDLWQQGSERLLAIPDFGRKSLDDLERELRKHGLIY